MVQSPEVVITGVGVVSPIGVGRDAFWKSLREGRSGVAPLECLSTTEVPVRFGAEIRDFDAKQFVTPRKSLKVMCREIQAGFSAAAMALQDAKIAENSVEPDRFGVVFAAEMYYSTMEDVEEVARHCLKEGEFNHNSWGEKAMSDVFPLWMLKYLPNMTACHLAILHNALGPNNSVGIGEASSLTALIEASRYIQRGHADVMIVGGSGSRLNLTPLMFRGYSNLSHRNDNPAAASRPFDADRDGMVNGEGAAAFILESRAYAESRGARIMAHVLGDSQSFETNANGAASGPNAYHRVINAALRSASLEADDIGHVNAHGVSTVEDDIIEARAIHDCLGDAPVTAPKSFFGNLGAAGGGVELAATVCAFDASEIPITLNYAHPDPRCPINVVYGQPCRLEKPAAISLNKSGTGQVAAVVLAAP